MSNHNTASDIEAVRNSETAELVRYGRRVQPVDVEVAEEEIRAGRMVFVGFRRDEDDYRVAQIERVTS